MVTYDGIVRSAMVSDDRRRNGVEIVKSAAVSTAVAAAAMTACFSSGCSNHDA